MEGAFTRSERYAPRPITFLGVRELPCGWRLKTYSILHAPSPLDRQAYDRCLAEAVARLGRAGEGPGRPGVGIAIYHRGRDVHMLVLGWWARENELPLRVYVRGFGEGAAWRPAREDESICVWDLEVLWFEREAFVRHVLAPEQGPDIQAYLDDHLAAPATPGHPIGG